MAEEQPLIQTTDLSRTFQALRNRNPENLIRQQVPAHPDYRRVPSSNYSPITSVNTGSWGNGMSKFASSGGIVYGQPQFFSPVHTPINWQIPSKRLEMTQWSFVDGDMIMTSDGAPKNIKDIKVGDKIVTHTGDVGEVDKTHVRETETNLYKISVSGWFDPFKVTEGHKIYVIPREQVVCKYSKAGTGDKICMEHRPIHYCNVTGCKEFKKCYNPELMPVENIKEGDFLYTPIPKIELNNSISISHARLLGYYCSEGCAAGKNEIIFTFNVNENEYMDEVIMQVNDLYGATPKVYINEEEHSAQLRFRSEELFNFCIKHCGRKAKEKTLSKEIMSSDNEVILSFLGTYYNGDGRQCSSDGWIVFSTASVNLANQVTILLAKCGIPSRTTRSVYAAGDLMLKNSTKKEFTIFRIVVSKSETNKLLKYADISINETSFRGTLISISDDKILRKVTNIEKTPYSGIVYDIRVPGNFSVVCNMVAMAQCRFFYENEPKVAAAIDFYSEFPMSNWEHECRNRTVKLYFDRFKERLKLQKWCRLISHEVHLIGDCFPFWEVSCPICNGSGRIGSDICEHDGGTIKRIIILNPDYVEVLSSPLNPDPIIAMRADEELINMVQRKTPGYEKLSNEVRKLISTGQPIKLDNSNVAHLMYGENGYSKYGTGMVRRLFPILSYKTKLMVAQWIVAERLIVPIKVVKVGDADRPAGPSDIAAVQAQLAQTANDPNLTIVTHHAFEMDFVGACHDNETEVLTMDGWKLFKDATIEDEIGTYNLDSGNLEYQKPIEKQEYDYDGEMCCFNGKNFDICVTPNHNMLVQKNFWNKETREFDYSNWELVRADQVETKYKFRANADWTGEIPEKLPFKDEHILCNLSLDDYLKFIGYYLSEGGLGIQKYKNKEYVNFIHITQKEDSKCFEKIKTCFEKIGIKFGMYEDKRSNPSCWKFTINNTKIGTEMLENYGRGCQEKKIPKWILNLPKRELAILLSTLMDGDGSVRFSCGKNHTVKFKYTTISKKLADAVQEIVLKLGYCPKISIEKRTGNRKDIHVINWASQKDFKFVHNDNISRKHYAGKVYCFTVPNGCLVTRRNGKMTIQGNSGKVLTLSNEFELINQEILDGMMINNALLNGEGPNFCHSDDTRILTNNGLKYRIELDIEKDLIATFNKETGALEYQKAIRKWEYDYNSIDGSDDPMKHFLTNRMDILVTPNHKMLYAPRKISLRKEGYGKWQTADASEIKKSARFRACVDKWNGKPISYEKIFGIESMDFLRIVGWYASEGWRIVDKNREDKVYRVGIAQSPTANPEVYNKIKSVLEKYNILHTWASKEDTFIISNTDNKDLVKYLSENLGEGSNTKHIPQNLKELDQESLKVLLSALVDGDGSERPVAMKKPTDKKYYSYTTVSTQLRDDVIEILFKLGFSPRFYTIKFDSPNLQTQYTISWGETEIGKYPVLDSRDMTVSQQISKDVIFDEDYIGKVWCVEVPNHFIITERNGLFGIHGNSAAAVGIEAMIQRLKTFREQITDWLRESIYIPEARRQAAAGNEAFITKNEDTGEEEVVVPKIKWDNMHLRDQQQFRTFVMQLYEKGLLSAQTVLETFDFDPDQEIERKRYDALQMVALGQGLQGGMGGGGGGGGGGMGGLPMPGGGGGETPIGAPDMGGPGSPSEGPSAPVGGGPAIAKSSSITATQVDPSQFGGRVLKKRTRERITSDQQKQQRIYEQQQKQKQRVMDAASGGSDATQRDEKGRIINTKAERDLIPHLKKAHQDGLFGNYAIVKQFRVQCQDEEYPLDFALPALKVGIEADGEIFHSAPKQKAHDKERDMKLSQQGWTILRFTDEEIEKHPQQIVQSIIKTVMQKQLYMKNMANGNVEQANQVPHVLGDDS